MFAPRMEQKEARAELWSRGVIFPWRLYDYQKPVYAHIRATRNPFFEATRRFGKTATMLVKVCEDNQRGNNRTVIWCEPWKEQARNIVVPEMTKLCDFASDKVRPKFYRTDSFFEFPSTGSRLYLVGVNEDRAEGARGRTADEIILDEMGSYVDAEYIINEVLRPLLLTTGGEMHEIGTPPPDLGHIWYDRKAQAIKDGRFIQRTIDSVDAIPAAEKARYIEEMGGLKSDAVRRELYCEPVADTKSLVIPEFVETRHVVDHYSRPEAFDTYVGIDLGFNDNTVFLFGFVDFINQCLVIEQELCFNGKNSKEIVSEAKRVEHELWQLKTPYRRIGDNELQQLYDMQNLYDYTVSPTRKDDKLAAINDLRLRFTNGRIKVNRRCKNLIYQLKVGMWNDRKTDFKRGEKTGHLDAIDALVYLNRNVDWLHNPYPQVDALAIAHDHFVPPPKNPFQTDQSASILDAFQPFTQGGG